jgi:hypothetical protein
MAGEGEENSVGHKLKNRLQVAPPFRKVLAEGGDLESGPCASVDFLISYQASNILRSRRLFPVGPVSIASPRAWKNGYASNFSSAARAFSPRA